MPQHDIRALAKLVAEMRHWQREYFRTRGALPLDEARKYEAKVDRVVRSLLQQPKLPGMDE
jgi:hypothetical protein